MLKLIKTFKNIRKSGISVVCPHTGRVGLQLIEQCMATGITNQSGSKFSVTRTPCVTEASTQKTDLKYSTVINMKISSAGATIQMTKITKLYVNFAAREIRSLM